MSTYADKGGSKREFKIIPAGTHLARCYSFIHIGHVPNTFPGATNAITNKIRLTWELPEELEVFKEDKGPQPHVISQEYTLSMNEKSNLRKMIQSWYGKQMGDDEAEKFDVELVVGKECLLTVIHEEKAGKTYTKIQNVTALPSKMKCPDAINPSKIVTWEALTKDEFALLPNFIQEKMRQATEFTEWADKNGIVRVAF